MAEYIYEIEDYEDDEDEIFVGWIRHNFPQLIRCKDCIHFDGYFCHHKGYGDGYANYTPPIKSADGFCDWADRREE